MSVNEQILKIMKNRLDNLLFHIEVNTEYEGEMKVLEQVSSSLKNILNDLYIVGTYQEQINNILWNIETNCKILGEEKTLSDVRQSLISMSNTIKNIFK